VDAEHTAVLVGAGQLTQREAEPEQAMSPPELMAEAARRAALDSVAGPALLEKVDYLGVVDTLGWQASNPARLVAEAVGAHPAQEVVSTIGGDTPQAFVNHIAGEIAAGRVRLALLAGCNAMGTAQRASKRGVQLDWPSGGEGRPACFGDARPGSNDYENRHGLTLPVMIYPLFENAFRAYRGWDLEIHRRKLGELFSELSKVAAANPYSWFPVARTPEEIYTPSPANRMVAFPYTKYMNAVMNVDQSAALVMTSVANARLLGIPEDRWVYLVGAGGAYEDPWWVSERPRFSSCPALYEAGEQALTRAGIGIEEIDFVDLYSCFPSAVELACEELGIPTDGSRPLTVTGGLSGRIRIEGRSLSAGGKIPRLPSSSPWRHRGQRASRPTPSCSDATAAPREGSWSAASRTAGAFSPTPPRIPGSPNRSPRRKRSGSGASSRTPEGSTSSTLPDHNTSLRCHPESHRGEGYLGGLGARGKASQLQQLGILDSRGEPGTAWLVDLRGRDGASSASAPVGSAESPETSPQSAGRKRPTRKMGK